MENWLVKQMRQVLVFNSVSSAVQGSLVCSCTQKLQL